MSNAECMNDQAVLHHIVMRTDLVPENASLDLQLDCSSSFFFNMHEGKRPPMRKLHNLSTCFYGTHKP